MLICFALFLLLPAVDGHHLVGPVGWGAGVETYSHIGMQRMQVPIIEPAIYNINDTREYSIIYM